MKDTYYFSHDYNSRNDHKVKKLISKHGYLGYGLFWAIIEDLYNNANALQTDCETIAFDLRTTKEIIKSILNDFDLFVFEGETFGSLSVQRRLEERDNKSTKARESAFKRWNKQKDNANALPTHSECNAIKERKGKKIESKLKEIPELNEFYLFLSEHLKEIGIIEPVNLKEYVKSKYDSWVENSWKDGNDKSISNWKSKIKSNYTYWLSACNSFKNNSASGNYSANDVRNPDYKPKLG